MTRQAPPTLAYEAPPAPSRRRFAVAAFVCWLGLLAIVAGTIVAIVAVGWHPADRDLMQFGLLLCCFGVTWWVLGLILREALRR